MKSIKYVIFMILICILSIVNVKAMTCKYWIDIGSSATPYGNQFIFYKFIYNGGTYSRYTQINGITPGNREDIGTTGIFNENSSKNITQNNLISGVNAYVKIGTDYYAGLGTHILDDQTIEEKNQDILKRAYEKGGSCPKIGVDDTTDQIKIFFIEEETVNKTCVYKMLTNTGGNGDPNNLITCNISNNDVTCTANFSTSTLEYPSLKSEYNCLNTIYADYVLNGTTYRINDLKKVNSCNNSCLTFNLINPTSNEEKPDNNNPSSNEQAPDEKPKPDNTGGTYPSLEEEPDDFNIEKFCSRPEVKGAFRALGWVIFFIKIIVPIIIIVMGSIDVFKAVTSNKTDEISKSVKTLVIRVIAGIIIFFIPTFINFVIKFVSGGEEIYSEERGTFLDCTHCMLNPTDDNCGSLMGGQ